jgi:gamma-tubulin complex component 2
LKNFGVIVQERILLDEVIGSFVGLEGLYVKFGGRDERDVESWFLLSEPHGVSFDTCLKNLINRILPLSTAFVHVRSFISSHRPGYEYGSVVQAFCESLDALLQEHLTFASKMEQLLRQSGANDAMTMNKLHVYVQSPLRRMTVLEQAAIAIREQKGGSLLNSLHKLKTHTFAGDDIAQKDLESLLQKASVPYFKMLEAWLESGVIHDPFDEFMIEMSERPIENTITPSILFGGYDGDVWNDMFRIRTDNVLEALLTSPVVEQQILLTGKYWNAVQLCPQTCTGENTKQSSLDDKFATHLQYGMDAVTISTHVHNMYRSASQQLLQRLVGDFDMMETLLTMKRYFLVHQGDFLVHLFDAAEDELLQELTQVSRGRVQHWLGMCVHLTEPDTDDSSSPVSSVGSGKPAEPLKPQMLRCSFAPESLLDHLDTLHAESGGIDAHEPKTPSRHPYGMTTKGITGVEAFTLRFDRIPFPTSLIISERALSSYQLLFRHLFFAKHVERRLVGIWLDHQMMKQFQSLRRAMGPTYCLRQRMLHFMQNFIYYMMFEVIEPNWLEMENAIRKQQSSRNIQTVDDIVKVHNEFLELALAECLLTNRELIRTLTKLMSTCLLFSEQLKRFMEATKIVSSEKCIRSLFDFLFANLLQADENQAVAHQKRSKIQRNLNDPSNMHRQPSGKSVRRAMTADIEERSLRMQKQAVRVERELANESYKRMIARFDEVFSENLAQFMTQLLTASNEEHHSQKANLCIRLDYNGYVTKQMGLH